MRILHVVEATTAGVRRHVYALASDQRHITALVACPLLRQAFGETAFVTDLQQAGVRVLPLPMVRAIRPAADVHALMALIRLIRREQIDLVHAHSSKAGVLGRLAARVCSVASVYTPHGLYFLGLRDVGTRHVFMQIERTMAGWCNRVIAVSPGEQRLLVEAGIVPADKVVCIENGIVAPVRPSVTERHALRAELGVADACPLIGSIARLTEQKNPRLFLEAAALVYKHCPTARFVWCGAGELREAAQRWASELGITHAVIFLGHREDAQAVLAACDQCWLTSNYEGLPTVLLEAMALGVPIVATDVVGNRDLLRGAAGLLVPPEQPARFARAALLLAERPHLQTGLAETGLRWVREHWNATRMRDETTALYATVLAERRRAVTRSHGQAAKRHNML